MVSVGSAFRKRQELSQELNGTDSDSYYTIVIVMSLINSKWAEANYLDHPLSIHCSLRIGKLICGLFAGNNHHSLHCVVCLQSLKINWLFTKGLRSLQADPSRQRTEKCRRLSDKIGQSIKWPRCLMREAYIFSLVGWREQMRQTMRGEMKKGKVE